MTTPAYLLLPDDEAIIAVGANLGDTHATIAAAVSAIGDLPETRVISSSTLYDTEPVGPPQPRYTNGILRVASRLSPRDLLESLLAIERSLGRIRDGETRWGPRTIDLDLIAVGSHVVRDDALTLPHPRAHERLFVLEPLSEVVDADSDAGRALLCRMAELRGEPT